MKSLRRAVAMSAVALLAGTGAVLLGATVAQAYPSNVTTQAGSMNYNLATAPVATFTQNSPYAEVIVTAGSLDIGLGETLNIVQSDPGMFLVLRNESASPIQWNGTINAQANLLVLSAAGINVNGTVIAGGDLVLSSGTSPSALGTPPFIPLSVTAASGAIVTGEGSSLFAGRNLDIAGNDITIAGSLHAEGSVVSLVSDDDVEYSTADTGNPMIADGAGFAGGLIQTTATAEVTAAGVVYVEATSPSTMLLDGNLLGDGEGSFIGEGLPGAVGVIGTAASNDGQFDAIANSAGPAGGQLGAHMFGGASTPFTSAAPFQLISYGDPAPNASAALVVDITVFEALETGFFIQCSSLENPEEPGSPAVTPYIDFALLGLLYEGSPIAPGGEPLANQAPIAVPGFGTVAVNEQATTVVDGWEILTGTALHIVTPTDDIRLGVVECARQAPAQLAATGADRADAQLGIAGAVMLALSGVVLLAGRRRRSA